ncbi:MAG: SDR family NAD(P)-dependent oxidoreductase [Pseudomonadota bacterium]
MTKVFVTGASGFIAKHIVRELLEKGYEVRGSVRSEKRKAEIEALFPDAKLEFAFLDLNKDAGWTDAMAGCDVLMHTASPFPMADPKDPEEVIRPAVDGTVRAMKAALSAGIKRVVLTSSNAAIYKQANKPIEAPSDETYWTTPDAPYVSPYEASKTLAEKAAWDFQAEHPQIALTTVNPGAVFGPAMDAEYGTSLELVERIMKRLDPMLPPMEMPCVDVRDVAMMHVAALSNEATEGERFSATSQTVKFIEMAEMLKVWDPSLKLATGVAPLWLLRVFAIFMPEIRGVIQNVGRSLTVSGAKAEKVFGFKFIPVKDAIAASAASIRKHAG